MGGAILVILKGEQLALNPEEVLGSDPQLGGTTTALLGLEVLGAATQEAFRSKRSEMPSPLQGLQTLHTKSLPHQARNLQVSLATCHLPEL